MADERSESIALIAAALLRQALEAMTYSNLDVSKFNRINAACAAIRAHLALDGD